LITYESSIIFGGSWGSIENGEPFIFLLHYFFATQNIGGAKELVVLV